MLGRMRVLLFTDATASVASIGWVFRRPLIDAVGRPLKGPTKGGLFS